MNPTCILTNSFKTLFFFFFFSRNWFI